MGVRDASPPLSRAQWNEQILISAITTKTKEPSELCSPELLKQKSRANFGSPELLKQRSRANSGSPEILKQKSRANFVHRLLVEISIFTFSLLDIASIWFPRQGTWSATA
jgi:hypothetical protein